MESTVLINRFIFNKLWVVESSMRAHLNVYFILYRSPAIHIYAISYTQQK